MRARIRLFALVAGAVSVSCYGAARYALPPPKLVCGATDFNLGAVEVGVKSGHVFVLKNEGGRPFRVFRVRSSCQCTSAVLSSDLIRPGETATLNVVINVPEMAARTVGHVTMETNDPENGLRDFTLSVDPSPVLAISPSTIDLGSLEFGRTGARAAEVTILCRDPDDLELQVEDWSGSSHVHSQIVHTASRPRLKVWADESIPIGPLTASIRLRPRSSETRVLNLSVRGEVTGPLRADPSRVFLTASESGAIDRTRVEIISEGKAGRPGVQILEVSAQLAGRIDARISDRGERRFLEIVASPSRLASNGRQPCRGLITLRCDDRSGATLGIPVSIN